MRLAVLEVGSNAIRLASAVWHPSGTLELVLRQHVPLRLGETVFSSGGVSDAALQKLCDALGQLLQQLSPTPQDRLQLCATSALRDANNLLEIRARLQHELGLELVVLSGAEEAARIREGLLQVHTLDSGTVVLGDLGGGSLEVSILQEGKLQRQESLNFGTLRWQRAAQVPELEASFHESVQILQSDAIATAKRLVLSGGNAKWLGRILAEETQHEFVPISGLEIPWAEVQPRLQKIAAAGPETWRTRWRMRPSRSKPSGRPCGCSGCSARLSNPNTCGSPDSPSRKHSCYNLPKPWGYEIPRSRLLQATINPRRRRNGPCSRIGLDNPKNRKKF